MLFTSQLQTDVCDWWLLIVMFILYLCVSKGTCQHVRVWLSVVQSIRGSGYFGVTDSSDPLDFRPVALVSLSTFLFLICVHKFLPKNTCAWQSHVTLCDDKNCIIPGENFPWGENPPSGGYANFWVFMSRIKISIHPLILRSLSLRLVLKHTLRILSGFPEYPRIVMICDKSF